MTKQQRLVLIISILASSIVFLDSSVINVALPAIGREFGGGLLVQQWVVDIYLITMGALMLIAGSLADIFGRKKIMLISLIGFAIASILCAVSVDGAFLILARGLQGVAGALLVPCSLALIMSSFKGGAAGKAIGAWTAWTGIAFVVGPMLGGFLVDVGSWRLIFAINLLPIVTTLWLLRMLESHRESTKNTKVDVLGATLSTLGLGGVVYSLIEKANYGWNSPIILVPLIIGLTSLIFFTFHELKAEQPMLPMKLFKVRNFAVGNVATAAIYAGLSIAVFLISIFLQQIVGYKALTTGVALLPVTILMFLLSSRFGVLAGKYGSRIFMTAGPLVAALGFLYMLMIGDKPYYLTQILPGVLLFGLGLSITIAPLTTTILGAIDQKQSGIASAVNNAIARIAGLIGVAALGLVTGPQLSLDGFHKGLIMVASLLILGAGVSGIGIQKFKHHDSVT
ncbi:MAG TPA: MFS transporter [Patescibacteria group bacterium]|nr:MFS transporter [Patescibacteria group bacterium]